MKIPVPNILKNNKKFYYSVAALAGTMVGVGVFGIPFSFAKAGFWVGLSFLIFTGLVTLIINLMYGEVVLRTQKKHQITGYAEKYLGNSYKKLMFFAMALTSYSALVIYVIIAGEFLNNILSPFLYFQPALYSWLFLIIMSFLVLAGIKRISWIELVLAVLFCVVILAILFLGWPKIDFNNFSNINLEFWFLPYGIMLFAFAGFTAIPILREILDNREILMRKAILSAVILVAVLYFIFAFTVIGISGPVTSPDGISGLLQFLGGTIVFWGSMFGILAVSTSFLMVGTAFTEMFHFDYGISWKQSWALAVLPPLILFFGGLRSFIDIMSLAGSVAVGIAGIVMALMHVKAKSRGDRIPEYDIEFPKSLYYLMILVFFAGIVYAILV
ncbi:MAG: hypothetical protein COV30_01665 [Candidatus Yanofskybacteria bacterium CG10_big_fil_rev_8_21_14_0_10_37_15]|uniref:Amino acid transporter transmembrane domain-containing protein n=1 Tax=Candidatus Yanofskybacteria bacterium CG10_big_fil_rev_8_21_14_0_10_37_15 TaxID=1975097 RepID=A0A2H0R5S7_9BACT|nr:MAG: hypothetical protein COV30_01665 [Candidatus Yanofskybacteria bacterium CG10_big_fil_rev_8_21_14_0_10_37_15]